MAPVSVNYNFWNTFVCGAGEPCVEKASISRSRCRPATDVQRLSWWKRKPKNEMLAAHTLTNIHSLLLLLLSLLRPIIFHQFIYGSSPSDAGKLLLCHILNVHVCWWFPLDWHSMVFVDVRANAISLEKGRSASVFIVHCSRALFYGEGRWWRERAICIYKFSMWRIKAHLSNLVKVIGCETRRNALMEWLPAANKYPHEMQCTVEFGCIAYCRWEALHARLAQLVSGINYAND